MKGAVSAQKALQGSETETRELLGGTKENSVPPMGRQFFFTKRKQKKIELVVARPVRYFTITFKITKGPWKPMTQNGIFSLSDGTFGWV